MSTKEDTDANSLAVARALVTASSVVLEVRRAVAIEAY
jgi:hypothetical protein